MVCALHTHGDLITQPQLDVIPMIVSSYGLYRCGALVRADQRGPVRLVRVPSSHLFR